MAHFLYFPSGFVVFTNIITLGTEEPDKFWSFPSQKKVWFFQKKILLKNATMPDRAEPWCSGGLVGGSYRPMSGRVGGGGGVGGCPLVHVWLPVLSGYMCEHQVSRNQEVKLIFAEFLLGHNSKRASEI